MINRKERTSKEKEIDKICSFSPNPENPQYLLFHSNNFTRDEYPEIYTDMAAANRTHQAYTRTALLFVGFAIALSDFLIEKTYLDMRAHFFSLVFATIGFSMFLYGMVRYSGIQMALLKGKLPMDLFAPWMMFIFGNIVCIVAISMVLAQ